MMENGLMTRLMATEFISTSMVHCIKETGKMTFNMEKDRRSGLMALHILVTIIMGKSKELDFTSGMTDQNMVVSGKTTRSMG